MRQSHNKRLPGFVISSVVISILLLAGLMTSFGPAGGQSSSQGSPEHASSTKQIMTTSRLSATQFQVNPYAIRTSEPAPMGISDYGVTPGGQAYSYNTSSFIGTASISSLYAYNSSINGAANGSTIQLNLNLQFSDGGKTYTYWVQDVAAIFSSATGNTQYITFLDNVWNLSSLSASMKASSITGNGQVATTNANGNTIGYYYDVASALAGNDITLKDPAKISMKETTSLSTNGVPEVSLMYNDGYGWVTYDTVFFSFVSGKVSGLGFVVNGYSYNPMNSFYDAELVIAGPGNASSTVLQQGSINMSLQYWNGENYQFIPNAYNFGSDTAETISGVSAALVTSVSSDSLFSDLSPGVGSPGALYSLSSLGTLNISLPFGTGTAVVNGVYYNFTHGGLNLTLNPGVYKVVITSPDFAGSMSGTFTLNAGQTVDLNENSFGTRYSVKVTEKGLYSGTPWTLMFSNGTSVNANASFMILELTNGTYILQLNSTVQYTPASSKLEFNVSGSSLNVEVNFTRLYNVSFVQYNLHGLYWLVNVSGKSKSSIGNDIVFTLPNGTYTYSVSEIAGYVVGNESGTISVNGSSALLNITFTPVKYTVSLKEDGLPADYNWSIFVNGAWHYSDNSTMLLHLPNGTYSFLASAGNGTYLMSGKNDTIFVQGNNSIDRIGFVSAYNSGHYLVYKFVFIVLLTSLAGIGLVAIRLKR